MTTDEDLAGFWDVIMIQINEVKNSFEKIYHLQESDWKEAKDQVVSFLNLSYIYSMQSLLFSPLDSPVWPLYNPKWRSL